MNYSDETSPHDMLVAREHNEQYLVLYNGNAEVVGNFRALNFYKASDINIKEDIRLLTEGTLMSDTHLCGSTLNFLICCV